MSLQSTVHDLGRIQVTGARGSSVPALPVSSSCDGPTATCSAGVAAEHAPAKPKSSGKELKKLSRRILRLKGGGSSEEDYEKDFPALRSRGSVPQPPNTEETNTFFRKPGPRSRTRAPQAGPSSRVSQEDKVEEIPITLEDDTESDEPPDKIVGMDGPELGREPKKRGRPPNTNSQQKTAGNISQTDRYISRREALQLVNDEEERRLQLKREDMIRQLSDKQLLQKSKVNLDKYMEEAEDQPSGEISQKAEQCMLEIMRIAKTSSNLKGTYQKSLKLAAAATIGGLRVLQTRAEKTRDEATSEEIGMLKKEIASIKAKLCGELELERAKTRTAEERADRLQREVHELKRNLEKRSGKESNSKEMYNVEEAIERKKSLRTNTKKVESKDNEAVPMEYSDEKEEEIEKVILPPREEWPPAIRPAIKGKATILHDVILPADQKLQVVDGRITRMKGTDQSAPNTSKRKASTLTNEQKGARDLKDIIRDIIKEELGIAPSSTRSPATKKDSGIRRRPDSLPRPSKRSRETSRQNTAPLTNGQETWAKVLGRRERKEARTRPAPGPREKRSNIPNMVKRKKPPRMAAVQILVGGKYSYAETIKYAKEKINIDELGITELRSRKAKTGAFLIEIPGPDNGTKADALATKLQEVFIDDPEIKITRPIKTADLRLSNLDDSITTMDILQTISIAMNCNHADIRVGPINKTRYGMSSAWVKCPVKVANELANLKKIRMGWTTAKVVLLPERKMQCFRCLEFGHVKFECKNEVDRSESCYRCGELNHLARDCRNPVKCSVCDATGAPSNHRMGGNSCNPKRKKRDRKNKPAPEQEAGNKLTQQGSDINRAPQDKEKSTRENTSQETTYGDVQNKLETETRNSLALSENVPGPMEIDPVPHPLEPEAESSPLVLEWPAENEAQAMSWQEPTQEGNRLHSNNDEHTDTVQS